MYKLCKIFSDVFDECRKSSKTGWAIGIKLPRYQRQDARFVFSLHQDGAQRPVQVMAHKGYDHSVWTHVAASFNGSSLNLYINGARISKQIQSEGTLFKNSYNKCVGMFVGGLPDEEVYFRGKLDELGMWKRALEHGEIVEHIGKTSPEFSEKDLVFKDSFETVDDWEVLSEDVPQVVDSDIVLPYHTIRLEAPSCGRTVCDDPEVVQSYLKNKDLLKEKHVKYRIVNLLSSDGKRSLVTDEQIAEQHRALKKIFEPYGVFMDLEKVQVQNSTLMDKVIMFDCFPYKIGNGICDKECAHTTTGNDAGDCDLVTSECSPDVLGNGFCNQECNKAYHYYDKGDCCILGDANSNCIDPNHPHR